MCSSLALKKATDSVMNESVDQTVDEPNQINNEKHDGANGGKQ